MKRFLKGLLAASLGLVAFVGLASCTQEPAPTCEHELGEKWERDSATHWKECSKCDEMVNYDVHDYTEFALASDKCVKTRECKVCGYVETRNVDHKYVDGVCTVCGLELIMPVYYVRGSFGGSNWPAEDDYKLVIDYASASAKIVVTLTAGDEFKVADATWSAEFNANTIKAEEGLFGGDNNIVVLTTAEYEIIVTKLDTASPECEIKQLCVHTYGEWALVSGKTCEYSATCSKCQTVSTKIEHAGYGEWTLVDGKTCDFEQVCACGDKKTKVEHTWGDDIVCDKCQAVDVIQLYVKGTMNGWSDNADYALVLGADKKSASLLLEVAEGDEFKVATSDWSTEFGTANMVFNVNGFEGDGNIKASKAGVYMINVTDLDTLEPKCSIDPIQLYVKGSMNGWGANADYALAYDKATDKATFTVTISDLSTEFKVAPDNWDLYNKHYNMGKLGEGYGYGTPENDAQNIKFDEAGNYVITVSGVTTGEPTITIVKGEGNVEVVVTPCPELYVKGSMNGWSANNAYKLAVDGTKATLKVYLEAGDEFKVADADWTYEFNSSKVDSNGVLGGDGNIKVLVSGYYEFTVDGVDNKATATCSAELVGQDAATKDKNTWKKADNVYGELVTEAGTVIQTAGKFRSFVVVDAKGRIAYFCIMPTSGYGNCVSDSYIRHSAYADYTKNPAFANIAAESYDEYGNKKFDLVVPEGGFALIDVHDSDAGTMAFLNFIVGTTIKIENIGPVNTNTINVDNLRVSYYNGDVTVTKYEEVAVKSLSIAEVNALTADSLVVVSGTVAYKNDKYYLVDGSNEIVLYNQHACPGDKITVVANYSSKNKNLEKFQVISVIEEKTADVKLTLTEVTNVNQLVDGAKIVIGYEGFVMGQQIGTIRASVNLDDPCAQVVTLVKSGSNWLLQVGENQYLNWGSGNGIATGSATDAKAQWTISIADGVTKVVNANTSGDDTRYLQYNVGSPRFVAYKASSNQKDIKLYIVTAE